jgi:hypothetical protein
LQIWTLALWVRGGWLMFFQIKHERRTGLQLIHHLQVGKLSRLEGYNGIGKSALVRLIQVCVGQHPYPFEPALWKSFCAGVGTARVILTDIEGAESIEWLLDASKWKADKETVTNIGKIIINGEDVKLDDVRRLLDVRTILGNEDLTRTLARRFARHKDDIHAITAIESPLRHKLGELDELLREAENALGEATRQDIAEVSAEESAARLGLNSARIEAAGAGKQLIVAAAATKVAAQLAEIEDKGSDLTARIEALNDEIDKIDGSLSELDRELAAASADTEAAKNAQRELGNAQRHSDRMGQKFQDSAMVVVRLSGEAGVRSPTDTRVAELRAQTQGELDSMASQLTLIHSAPEVADVADDLVERLDRARDTGLGDDLIVNDESMDIAYSVTQLRERLDDQSRRLRALPPPDEAENLQSRIGQHRQLLTTVDRLAEAIIARRDAEEKARAARERLTAAMEEVASSSVGDVDALITRRKTLTSQMQESVAERANLIRARAEMGGGATPEELRSQLAQLLNELKIQEEDLASVHQAALTKKESTHNAAEARATEHRSAAQRLRAAQQDLGKVTALLAEEPKFAWIRSSASHLLPSLDADPAVQARLFEQILAAIQAMRDRITALQHQLSTSEQSFNNAYEQLLHAGTQSDETGGIRSWFGEEVSGWFNLPQLLETVFEHADHVEVDLNEMAVSWDLNGDVVSRPLGAFSSGERAFAYTRAQLALIDSAPAPANRLIVLDEFGAFMAREWQHRLEQYLRERARDNSKDRTLLVLPLTQTTDDLQAEGHADEELAQLRDMPGYYVRNLPV